MTLLEAIILGVVQGLTEFFPVSSSGHLVMTEELLELRLPGVAFEVALHVATLLSVLIVYRQRLIGLARAGAERETWNFVARLVVATIPAVIVGLFLKDWFEARFDDPVFAATMLLVTGCIVWSSRWPLGAARSPAFEIVPVAIAAAISILAGTAFPFMAVLGTEIVIIGVARLSASRMAESEPGWGSALAMGIAQAAAILPGISRSGSTVVTGLWRRVDPVAAAEFSFLMSIPAILGAAILSLPDLAAEGATVGVPHIVAGGLAAAVAGVLAIRFFVDMLRRRSFHHFALYCWVASALFLLTR